MFSSILAELVIGLHYFCLIFLCHELHSNKMKAPNGSRYRRLGEKGLETGNRQSSEKAKKTRRVPAVPCIIPVHFRDALLAGVSILLLWYPYRTVKKYSKKIVKLLLPD